MYLLRAQGNHRIAHPFCQQEEAAIRSPRATRTCSLRQSRPRGTHAPRVQSSGTRQGLHPPTRSVKKPHKAPAIQWRSFYPAAPSSVVQASSASSLPSPSRAQPSHAPVARASSLPPLLFPSLPKSCVPRLQLPPNPADSAPPTPADSAHACKSLSCSHPCARAAPAQSECRSHSPGGAWQRNAATCAESQAW